MASDTAFDDEKPQNGLAGLKHWRHDMLAGLVVSLISVPFSLGIAVASGAPPICGLISAIIAGLVLPFLGGSYVTVSGPAAGLAPVLLASMMLLGQREPGGRLSAPARRHLLDGRRAGGAGPVQGGPLLRLVPVLGRRGDARGDRAADHRQAIAAARRPPVPSPTSSGASWPRRPRSSRRWSRRSSCSGSACLALIFVLASLKARWLKVVPPQVIAAVFGLDPGPVHGAGFQVHDPHPRQAVRARHRAAELPGRAGRPLALVGRLHHGAHAHADRRRRVAGHDRRDRQDRPLPPQVGPEPDALRDGRLEHVLEHGRRADDHPRRGQEHGLHRRRRPDAVGELLQRHRS